MTNEMQDKKKNQHEISSVFMLSMCEQSGPFIYKGSLRLGMRIKYLSIASNTMLQFISSQG